MFTSLFFRRLFIPYLVLICLATASLGIFAGVRIRERYFDDRRQALRDELQLVSMIVEDDIEAHRIAELNQRAKALGAKIDCRITVIADDGTVLADNWADPAAMENHIDRPEIVAAWAGAEASSSSRHSHTIDRDLMYMAMQVRGAGGMVHYLRLAVPLSQLNRELGVLYTGLAVMGLIAMAGAGGIVYLFARRQARPVLELTRLADALARGQLDRRTSLSDRGSGELGRLGSALNEMAGSMQQLLAQAVRDKSELLTMLSSMSEGVVATDVQQRVVVANEAAGQLLGFNVEVAHGKPLWQVLRMEKLIKAADAALQSGQKTLLEAGWVGPRHVEISLCPYPATGLRQGMVLVAHDTTQSMRYEELRKEFVANVSHELRTPLTVIRGFVETLREGVADSAKAAEYLSTIERHTRQITNLVDDLLELSRLESQSELPRRSGVDIASAAARAVELLTPAAQKKGHQLEQDLQHVPLVMGDADYIERAIANLIDNAVKYTAAGGRIRVATRRCDRTAVIEVSDNGIGIPQADLPRIFERFYRVDRSRSREMGGTGLGLAIVKHIAQAHGGIVEVSSEPGVGSTFRIKLPLPPG